MSHDDSFDLKGYLGIRKAMVDKELDKCLPQAGGPTNDLIKAMRYSLFAGGKRLRPILCMAGAEAVGGNEEQVLPVACALEFIQTYSLIHDDLPLMDDDDLRRGKPTCHKVFGDALALLAGDALLTEAFTILSNIAISEHIPAGALLRVVGIISRASGYAGMVGGQVADIQSQGTTVDLSFVQFIHSHKTAALIEGSVAAGAVLGGGNEEEINALSDYGRKIGLAFQISDDILDIESTSETLGKKVGADVERGKATYPSVVGMKKSKDVGLELVAQSLEAISAFDHRAAPLRKIARYIVERKK